MLPHHYNYQQHYSSQPHPHASSDIGIGGKKKIQIMISKSDDWIMGWIYMLDLQINFILIFYRRSSIAC